MGTEPQKAKPASAKQRGNIANLRPWKPGQSGNPKGRPKGMTLTGLLRKAFEDSPEKAQEFIAKTIAFAMEGQAPYAKEVWERMDGKVRDVLEISGGPIPIRWPHEAPNVEGDEDEPDANGD